MDRISRTYDTSERKQTLGIFLKRNYVIRCSVTRSSTEGDNDCRRIRSLRHE